jgi:hypothetical protein
MKTKYLFIELLIRQSDFEHNHRVLTTTILDDIHEAGDRYAATYWDEDAEKNDDNWWVAFGGEMWIRTEKVVELSETEYRFMSDVFSGVKRLK